MSIVTIVKDFYDTMGLLCQSSLCDNALFVLGNWLLQTLCSDKLNLTIYQHNYSFQMYVEAHRNCMFCMLFDRF